LHSILTIYTLLKCICIAANINHIMDHETDFNTFQRYKKAMITKTWDSASLRTETLRVMLMQILDFVQELEKK
jgi:hypothetical protein